MFTGMPLGEYRHGALAVVCSVETPTWVNDALQRIDHNLFCEKQLGFDGREVWCVVEDTGEQRGPDRYVTVYEFRGPNGEPVPYLHEAIVDEMKRREKDGTGNILAAREIVRRRNADRLQQKRDETNEAYHEIAKDFEDHRKIGHFTVLHRSPALAASRRRATAARNNELNAIAQAMEIARRLDRDRGRRSLVGLR